MLADPWYRTANFAPFQKKKFAAENITIILRLSGKWPTFLHCFHICDTKCTYKDTAVQPARWFLLALQFVGPKPCKSFFVLTKRSFTEHAEVALNSVLEENTASAIDFEWEFYPPNKNIYEQCICCVSQLFHRRFNPGTLRIAHLPAQDYIMQATQPHRHGNHWTRNSQPHSCGGFDPHPPSNNAGSQAQGVTSPVHGLMYRPFAVDVRCETNLEPSGRTTERSYDWIQPSKVTGQYSKYQSLDLCRYKLCSSVPPTLLASRDKLNLFKCIFFGEKPLVFVPSEGKCIRIVLYFASAC